MMKSILSVLLVFIGTNSATCWAWQTETAGIKQQSAKAKPAHLDVQLQASENQVAVKVGGQHFTTYDFKTYEKPILFPVNGPGQVRMTRNWPMVKDTPGEETDHPHHKSIWVGHHVDGVRYWEEKTGRVDVTEVKLLDSADGFVAKSNWVVKKTEQKQEFVQFTDETTYRFGGTATSRWVDCSIKFVASQRDITFDDTKEGLFAARVHPHLRSKAKPNRGVKEVFGSILNSSGHRGSEAWGKSAKWVAYQGPIEGVPMTLVVFDHSKNLRHPTTWHARDYGLVAANPFGIHYFQGKEKGAGKFLLKKGETLSLRYRIEFLSGIQTVEQLNARFEAFCGE